MSKWFGRTALVIIATLSLTSGALAQQAVANPSPKAVASKPKPGPSPHAVAGKPKNNPAVKVLNAVQKFRAFCRICGRLQDSRLEGWLSG